MSETPERRASDARIERIEERIDNVEKSLAANTQMTAEVYAIIGHARSFFSVLGWVGNGVKWVAAVLAACVVLWATLTGKGPGAGGPA